MSRRYTILYLLAILAVMLGCPAIVEAVGNGTLPFAGGLLLGLILAGGAALLAAGAEKDFDRSKEV